MFRSILAVLGGTAVGVFTISLVQTMSQQLYPTPAQIIVPEVNVIAGSLPGYPTEGLLVNLLGFALGSFFGGMVAARVTHHRLILHALLVGIFLLAMGLANLLPASYPLWFKIVAFLIFLPMAYFGGMMSARRMP
ncbi:hypothetical protein [Rufibacter aurantiacus]|uniref:hypothetical protein n=1 Tax=Rufibacter aurantiacus TaxID=2817374 RepID=UPI001B30AE0F|nr:hypothetical protein [Rufibacter aurantiacus]